MSIKNRLWRFIKRIANLNFSICLLICIAFCIAIGSIIEQEKSLLYYQINYPVYINNIFNINWRLIVLLGLDRIYSTWWFFVLITFFGLSLVICTLSSQLPSLRNARQWKFFDYNILSFVSKSTSCINKNSLSNFSYSLSMKNYYIFHKKDSIYAYKGLPGRIAPIIVHIAMIIALLGFTLSFLTTFIVQEMIPEGEIGHFKNVIKSGSQSFTPVNFFYKVNSFSIIYNKDGSVKQFLSNILIFSNNYNLLTQQTISVNNPLKFNYLTFYQTDWKMNALRIKLSNNHIFQKKLFKLQVNNRNGWLCILPLSQNNIIFLYLSSLKNNILVFNSNGEFIFSCNIGQHFMIDNNFLCIDQVLNSSGLQIKMDRGILIVYIGFFLLMISTVTSYQSYSQIWSNSFKDKLYISGASNRAITNFEEDVLVIQQIYNQYTFLE